MQNNSTENTRNAQKRGLAFWNNALIMSSFFSAMVFSCTVVLFDLGLAGLLSCFLPAMAIFLIQQLVFSLYLSFSESSRRLRLWFLKLSTTLLSLVIIARFLSELGLMVSVLFVAGVTVGVFLNILGAIRFSNQLSTTDL